MNRMSSPMQKTIHGAATIRSLPVICVVLFRTVLSGTSPPRGNARSVKVSW